MFRQVQAAAAVLYRAAASRSTAPALVWRCASAAVTPRALFSSSGATRAAGPHLASATPFAGPQRTLLPASMALDSPSFPILRARGAAFVDKTSAIADLLVSDAGMHQRSRAFFARPRKFGKSLTLDVAAEMLAAGALPAGVTPWPGYAPVDVDAVFGGLAVHKRLRSGDSSLRGLLERAHFVVKLGLGDATTGSKLEARIISSIAGIAGSAFDASLKAEVRLAVTPGDALEMLARAVPRGVPVALLIDEYDGAIIQDVAEGEWAAAKMGIKALRSLLMSTKAPDVGARIERCLVTGVARFARTSLFSGANNFSDLTDDPLLSRVLGFSEAEIRDNFPVELERLAVALKTDTDGAIAELARWYNGYSFDGISSCFNPYPVLVALRAGTITERELDAASGTNWLSLAPGDVVEGLAMELQVGALSEPASVDVADLEARCVRAVPLLLQTGLLSLIAGRPGLYCAPNEYARRSMQRMIATALKVGPALLAPIPAALRSRDRFAFSEAVTLLFEQIPRSLFKSGMGVDDGGLPLREAFYHAALFAALKSAALPDTNVQIQVPSVRGLADIVVTFSGAPRVTAWVIEIGLGVDAAAKLPQAQQYAQALSAADVFCCAIVVNADLKSASVSPASGVAVAVAWSQRVDSAWALL